MLGESAEFERLRHAVEKAAGDREHAIRNVFRLYTVNNSTCCHARFGQLLRNPIPRIPDGTTCPRLERRGFARSIAVEFGFRSERRSRADRIPA